MLWTIFLHNPTAVLLALTLHIGLAMLLLYKSSTPLTNKDGENKFSIQAKVIDIASIKRHARKFAKIQDQQNKAQQPQATQQATQQVTQQATQQVTQQTTKLAQTEEQHRSQAALIAATKKQEKITRQRQQMIKTAKLQREFMRQQEKAATTAKHKTEIKHQAKIKYQRMSAAISVPTKPQTEIKRQHTNGLSQEINHTTAINELQQALAVEEQERETYELATLQSQIYEKIRNSWRIPPHTNKLHCTLRVRINTNGDVLSIQVQNSSGNKLFDASTERAVYRSSPLPVPQNKQLFDEFLVLEFTPNQD